MIRVIGQVVAVASLIGLNPALAGGLGDLIDEIKRLSVQGLGPENELAHQKPADVQERSPAAMQERSPAEVQEPSPTSVKVPLVPFEAFPWQVGLVVANEAAESGFFCGGVLVAEHWVLTAAHCIVRGRTFDVVTGDSSLHKIPKRYAVSEIFVHPDWDELRYENDIALVGTQEPVNGVAVRLPDFGRGEQLQEGVIGQVVGWGVTQSSGPFSPDLLLLQTTIISGKSCQGPSRYTFGVFHEGQFCAKSLLKDHDVCQGFGGSPLLLNNQFGQRYVAGLASWSDGCPPDVVKPSVYTNVFWYADWIKHKMEG